MINHGKATISEKADVTENSSQSEVAVNNRLEALRVLSNSILREVEALKKGKISTLPGRIDLSNEVQNFEKDLIRCALVRTGGRQRKAAKLLNVKVTTLNAKIKRYGINPNSLYLEIEP